MCVCVRVRVWRRGRVHIRDGLWSGCDWVMCEVTDLVHVFQCMQPGLTYTLLLLPHLTSLTENFKGGWEGLGGGGIHYDVV